MITEHIERYASSNRMFSQQLRTLRRAGGAPIDCMEAGIRYVELPVKTDGVRSFFGETPVLTDQSDGKEVEQVSAHAGGSCAVTLQLQHHQRQSAGSRGRRRDASQTGPCSPAGRSAWLWAGAGEAESARERAVLHEHLREIGDHAGRLGITYCFETHPGVCQNADGMLETMSALAHDALRLNFDTGNVLYYNQGADVIESLRRVVSYVEHVHLKDSRGTFEEWNFPALGAGGAVDFRVVREVLDEAGFSGPVQPGDRRRSRRGAAVPGGVPATCRRQRVSFARLRLHRVNCGGYHVVRCRCRFDRSD